MITRLMQQIFGTRNERLLAGYRKIVDQINKLEPQCQQLSDAQLSAKTQEFRQKLASGMTLEKLLPEAFAVVREASRRVFQMRPFDMQCIGAMVLNDGKIAEMRTGEGKTLMATLACYLNALPGRGVHVVTVNDYLAQRDANWMRPLYEFLGLTLGINISGLSLEAKQQAYNADITYGTNNEFGFDYLRDNMVFSTDQRVQRPLNFAIVDEVDSILIDEARTPLIISGHAEESSELYVQINQLIPHLTRRQGEEGPGDYSVDEKSRQVFLTEEGHQHVEELFSAQGLVAEGSSLYDAGNILLMHYLLAALRAHALYHRDIHYIVKDNQVIIVDEHTGRLMPGRRWSEGLHQAVEAKEGVAVQLENQTLASITFQNYFRLYAKLAGMTGTADTEAYEFQKIYGLEVVVIPTNRPMVRDDAADMVFLTAKEKSQAILQDVKTRHLKMQPILVGTTSIESSELLAKFLQKEGIHHEVLNAKQHEREAKIIAQAGRPGAVTIATNMAGRGTDIVLGGSLEVELTEAGDVSLEEIEKIKTDWKKRHDAVVAAGGLHVLGTERHESRRIDNQLRGRSGRQGDPGSSQFYLSLEDNLLRIFAADRMGNLMRRLGVQEGEVIQHSWVTRAIENAQRRVEGLNFDMRKQLLEYDDVANDQRKVIYHQRRELLEAEDISPTISSMRQDAIDELVQRYIPADSIEEQWDAKGLEQQILQGFGFSLPIQQWLDEDQSAHESSSARISDEIARRYQEKIQQMDADWVGQMQKMVVLQNLDLHWREHLAAMDHMRQGIHLRGYAQKNPTQEFKREAFNLFTGLLSAVKYDVAATLSRLEMASPQTLAMQAQPMKLAELHYEHQSPADALSQNGNVSNVGNENMASESDSNVTPFVRGAKVGRNDVCPCGSGKKYKNCHGQLLPAD